MYIDIVPFGGIANSDNIITWPQKDKIEMSVLGFEEVFNLSTTIRLSNIPTIDIKIPTLPGLVILILLSWEEKYPVRQKDAEDVLFMMKNYEFAGNIDRLYGDEFSLLESEDYDNKIAGIKLLGKDITKVCDKPTLEKIKSIISEEIRDDPYSKLVTQMTGPFDNYEDILALLVKLYEGIIA